MSLTEEEKKELARINQVLGSGLTADEEAELLATDEQIRILEAPEGAVRVPRKGGGYTEIRDATKKVIPDVRQVEFAGRGLPLIERTVEGKPQSLAKKKTFIPDVIREDVFGYELVGGRLTRKKIGERVVPNVFDPAEESIRERGREVAKSAVSGVDMLTGLASLIPGVDIAPLGEDILTSAEDVRGGGQALAEDLIFGLPLDIALTGGIGAIAKGGVKGGLGVATKAGLKEQSAKAIERQLTTFPTVKKALQKARGKPIEEFGEALDVEKTVKPEDVVPKAEVGVSAEVKAPEQIIARETPFQRAKAAVERAETTQGPLPKKVAGRRTLSKMGDTEKSRRVINEMGKEFEEDFKGAAGRKSVEEIEQAAEAIGLDPLLKREMGAGFSSAEQRALTNAALGEIESFTQAIEKGALGDAAEVIDRMLDLQFTAVRATSESARATRMAAEIAKSRPVAQTNLSRLVKEFGGKEAFTAEMRRRMEHPGFLRDRQLVGQFIRDFTKASSSEKFYELWMNSILSGIPTHVINNASNTLFFASRFLFERPVAATLDLLASGGGLIRPRERFFRESFAELMGLASSLKMSPRALWESYRRNAAFGVVPRPVKTLSDPALANEGKLGRGAFQEAARAFDTGVPAFGATKVEGATGTFGKAAIKGKFGGFVRIPERGLVGADEFYKNVNLVTDFYARAYRQASKEAERGAIKHTGIPARMAEIIKNPSEDMLGLAKAEATYRTFQKELGAFGKKVTGLRDPKDGIGQILQYVIPFVRTPMNIAKAGLEFTPLNVLRIAGRQAGIKRFGSKLAAGELQDEMAKATAGSMIAGGVYLLSLEGKITGSAPRNAKERMVFYEMNKQPYTIEIGGLKIPYGRLEPVGMSIGLVADFMQNRKSWNPTDVAMALTTSMAHNVIDKTWAKGAAKLMEAMTDPERYQEHLLEGFAASVSPNFLTRLSRGVDPTLRDPKGSLEALAATQSGTAKALASGLEMLGIQERNVERLREFSELVGPLHTMWGERVRLDKGAIGPDGDITGPLFRAASPGRLLEDQEDAVTNEVNRLAKIDTAAIPPSVKATIQKFERETGKRLSTDVIDAFATGRGRENRARAEDRMMATDWAGSPNERKIRRLRRSYARSGDRWKKFLSEGKRPTPYRRRRSR